MRIDFGTAEHFVHSLDQSVRDDVFELFRLVVHLVPAQAHHLHQKQLDQAMASDYQRRQPFSGPGQPDSCIRRVMDEARIRKCLDHRRGRAGRHAHAHGEVPHRHQAIRVAQPNLLSMNDFNVVLDGAGRDHLSRCLKI